MRTWVCLALTLCAALPLAARAQRARPPEFADAPLPPRLDAGASEARASGSPPPPNRARLAPLPEERVEEIVVSGEGPWRLPDLGSDWRRYEEAERERRRYRLQFLPPYDANAAPPIDSLFLVERGVTRPGTVQIFRWRPGRRDSDDREITVAEPRDRGAPNNAASGAAMPSSGIDEAAAGGDRAADAP